MSQTVRELHKKRMKMWEESMSNHKKYIDAETGIFTVSVGRGKTLEEAISFAQRYMEENEVEYGITFSKNVLQDTNPKE